MGKNIYGRDTVKSPQLHFYKKKFRYATGMAVQ